MSQAIELFSKLQNASDIERIGHALGKSGMFGVSNVEAGVVILLTCAAEGITPMDFARTYDVIGGKPRKKAMAALAEFHRKGGKSKWVKTGDDGKEASAEFDWNGQKLTVSYTIDQAKKAQLVKPNSGWEKNPSNMLRARVVSNALGMLCPEIFAGYDDDIDVPTQALNLGTPITATPQPEVKPVTATVITIEPPKPESTTVTTPTKIETKTVDAEVLSETKAAPQPETKPVAAPAGSLSAELLDKVAVALAGHEENAVRWMLTKVHGSSTWLTPEVVLASIPEAQQSKLPGNTPLNKALGYIALGHVDRTWFSHLTELRANRILKDKDAFIRAISVK